jgi:hypothetical protein
MKWIYHIQSSAQWQDDGKAGIQAILLRPVWMEDGKEYTSGIVDLLITSIKHIKASLETKDFDKEEKEYLNSIFEKITNKPYLIEEQELDSDDKNIYLNKDDIYVQERFAFEELLHWVKIYFAIKGYPCAAFQETDFDNFAFDVNPILRVFSVDNAKRFEDKFGPEWWKKKQQHKSDKELINRLLDELGKN